MKVIELTKGKTAVVDDEDFERLAQWRWSVNADGYAIRQKYDSYTVRNKAIFMHHEVIGRKEGMQVDHKNGNRTDNRRQNLRHCTHSENCRNSFVRSDNKLGIKGVSFHQGKYRARIFDNGKRITLGRFKTPEEAKLAYGLAALKLHGEFSKPLC